MPFTFLGALYTGAFKHYLPPCVYLQITNIKHLLFYNTYIKISTVANKSDFTLRSAFILPENTRVIFLMTPKIWTSLKLCTFRFPGPYFLFFIRINTVYTNDFIHKTDLYIV